MNFRAKRYAQVVECRDFICANLTLVRWSVKMDWFLASAILKLIHRHKIILNFGRK